jgi:hypothetical protein
MQFESSVWHNLSAAISCVGVTVCCCRWFVLKQGKIYWFKSDVVTPVSNDAAAGAAQPCTHASSKCLLLSQQGSACGPHMHFRNSQQHRRIDTQEKNNEGIAVMLVPVPVGL